MQKATGKHPDRYDELAVAVLREAVLDAKRTDVIGTEAKTWLATTGVNWAEALGLDGQLVITEYLQRVRQAYAEEAGSPLAWAVKTTDLILDQAIVRIQEIPTELKRREKNARKHKRTRFGNRLQECRLGSPGPAAA